MALKIWEERQNSGVKQSKICACEKYIITCPLIHSLIEQLLLENVLDIQ